MGVDESLSEVFDINPIEYVPVTPSNTDIVVVSESTDAEEMINDDYTYVRNNIRNLLGVGNNALYDALEVARESENPRAYEVVGTLLKQISDINQQLMDIHAQKQKLSGTQSSNTDSKTITNNNAIFVGTTDELSKMIKNMSGE